MQKIMIFGWSQAPSIGGCVEDVNSWPQARLSCAVTTQPYHFDGADMFIVIEIGPKYDPPEAII